MLHKQIKFFALMVVIASLSSMPLAADTASSTKIAVVDARLAIFGSEAAQTAVKEFEERFAKFVGTKYSIGVGNGLDALSIILRSYKELGQLNDGDEIIVPANTYIATILSISQNGLKPVLAEPDLSTFNLSVSEIESKITKKTKAIMPVHLYGMLAPMLEINKIAKKNNLLVIEDSAQAHGAKFHEKSLRSEKKKFTE